jgi:hypothetical protein
MSNPLHSRGAMTNKILVRSLRLSLVVLMALGPSCLECSTFAQQATEDPVIEKNLEAIAFRMLFRRVADYKKMSDDAEVAHRDKTYLRRILPDRLKLSADDATRLERISIDCQKDIEPLEEEALVVMEKFSSRFPRGMVAAGMDISPPPELAILEELEDSVVLRHRDLLKGEMRAEDYQQTDHEVRRMFGGGFSTESPHSLHPAESSQVSK